MSCGKASLKLIVKHLYLRPRSREMSFPLCTGSWGVVIARISLDSGLLAAVVPPLVAEMHRTTLARNHQPPALSRDHPTKHRPETSDKSPNRHARQIQASLGFRLGAATIRMRLASIQQPRRILLICQPQDTWCKGQAT